MVMTKAATVVRFNKQLSEAYAKVCELEQRAKKCSLSDTGNWTNQNVVFTKVAARHVPGGESHFEAAHCSVTNAAAPTSSPISPCPVWLPKIPPSSAARRNSGATGSKKIPASG